MTVEQTDPDPNTKSVVLTCHASRETVEKLLTAFESGALAHLGVTGLKVGGPVELDGQAGQHPGDKIIPVRIEEVGDPAPATKTGWTGRAKRPQSDRDNTP